MSEPAAAAGQDTRRDSQNAKRRRSHVVRWRMREAHRDLARSKNQQKCGLVRRSDDVEIVRRDDTLAAHFTGLVSCGSWSACPVCSTRIGTEKGHRIKECIENGRERGHDVMLATLTIAHHAGAELAPMYKAIAEAWSFCMSGKGWQNWKARLGIVEVVRAFDCTHSRRNSWHPHLHVLIFTDRRPNGKAERAERAAEVEAFRAWISRRWADRIERQLGAEFRPDDEHGVKVQGGHNAGWYVAKMGLGRELSQMHTKVGRKGHRTPFQVLRDYAKHRRKRDRELWREWTDAMYRKQHIPGLTSLCRRYLPEAPQLTDEQIAEQKLENEHWIYTLPGDLYSRIASVRMAPAALLDAAEQGGTFGVERAIRKMIPRIPVKAHRRIRELQAEQDRAELVMRFTTAAKRCRDRRRAEQGPDWMHGRHHPDGTWRPVKDSWEPPSGGDLWTRYMEVVNG